MEICCLHLVINRRFRNYYEAVLVTGGWVEAFMTAVSPLYGWAKVRL